MKRSFTIDKSLAIELKEIARDKNKVRVTFLGQIINDLADSLPDYDELKMDEKVLIQAKSIDPKAWRKIERYAIMNHISATQMVNKMIISVVKKNRI